MICCLNPDCNQPINPEGRRFCQYCRTRLKPKLRNRYKVIKPIGRGGFGKTYLAEDTDKLNELCVVKQLAFGGFSTPLVTKAKELFEQEAQQLQRLGEHRQIPALFAYFEEDKYLFLVQQFIKGQNLVEKLKKQDAFSDTQIRELLLDLLPILKFIHSKGIIHRDIKPGNIMCRSDDGKYVLIDFGISKILSSSLNNQTGTSLGSQGYAAPEQLLEGKAVPASDLYSLGACCVHLLSGINPLKFWLDRGYGWTEEWQKSIKSPLSPSIESVLSKLLENNIDKRYQKAEQVLNDLQPKSKTSTSTSSNPPKPNSRETTSKPSQDSTKETLVGSMGKMHWIRLTALMVTVVSTIALGEHILTLISELTGLADPPVSSDRAAPFDQTKKTFAAVEQIPSGLFSHGGSATWSPIRKKVNPAIEKTWPKFKLRYVEPISSNPNSSSGIEMLLDDELAFSHSSRPLHDEEYEKAKIRGYKLKEIAIAIDSVAIATHPSLSIPGLTLSQLKDIYTGKISNWKEVGGPDLLIVVYSHDPNNEGTGEFFFKHVLGGENLGTNVVIPETPHIGIKNVASNPGAIYYSSAIEIVPKCNVKALPIGKTKNSLVSPYQEPLVPFSQCKSQPNKLNKSAFQSGKYPLTRRLFVIVKQDNGEDELAGIAYTELLLTTEGQKLISQAGFVPIHPIDD
ncbi:MAG: substrate-binding domain-containing protein [Prochloraceae cyanobacterium]|nr:substrate-binding domain-containing protein [Prochloraceae cyanobacterium]